MPQASDSTTDRNALGHSVPLAAAVAPALLVLMLALLGLPWWALIIGTGIATAATSWLSNVYRRRAQTEQMAVRAAMARLGAGDPEDGTLTERQNATRLDALADEVAARLDEASGRAEQHARWLAAVPDPLLVIDEADVIRLCNAPASDLLGLPAARLLGRNIEQVFTQADLLRIVALARRSGMVRLHVQFPGESGAATWEVAAAGATTKASAGDGAVVLMLRDVSEQALALQVKADFVANASHELRTPIAALRMAIETLMSMDEHEEPGMRQKLLGMIAGNVASLEEMARDLLDLSRVEAEEAEVRLRDVDLEDLALALRDLFEGICRERRLELRFEIDPSVRRISTDPDLLNLILRNLIDNATRFAAEATVVRVTAAPTPHGHIRLEVIDKGPGIPLAFQQRIFERYFQVDSARTTSARRRGSGLGLAIVKHAVRRLGGTIRVNSVWQQGTTMIVELPG
jgi:two-component system, OmpR family, phosphate regulon sensor histidine kinase PhoR